MTRNKYISVVIPAYNEEEIIEESLIKISEVITKEKIEHDIIVIDDGSTDTTWAIIQKVASLNSHIKGLRFSRNFGKESAIFAGLEVADGDCIVFIDADLQHPPKIILDMYVLWLKGNIDVVRAIKINRGKENIFYKTGSFFFYKVYKIFSGINLKNESDFVLIDKRVANQLKNFPESTPFFRGLLHWVGFQQKTVIFEVNERSGGSSKWKINKLIKYAISNLLAFSSLPLKIINLIAFIFFSLSLFLGFFSIYRYYNHQSIEGFTTVIILLLLVGSFILFALGIIGEYIANIYNEIKSRPRYILMDSIKLDQKLRTVLSNKNEK